MQTQDVIAHLEQNEKASVERLMDWLRIPSVSTDPAYREDVARAGQWCADRLAEAGFEVEVIPTGTADEPGHPVVLATTPGDDTYQGPHVLFYGHYDVQPAEPLELWDSPPYEPVIQPAEGQIGERVVARGASDDKGQVASFIEAMLAWKAVSEKAAGGVRMTILIEGEEESGSKNLEMFVDQHKDQLDACDVCVISDTGMLGRGRPAITYGVRGLAYTEITLHGPDQDLHSGLWGGRVPNPVNELAKVLAQLWDEDRRVTIPGFYDDVRPIGDDERAQWASLGVDPVAALKGIGLGPEADIGEKGFNSTEREWARPTCDINGIYGGYMGEGAKTVIAAKATAKVSFRLVADQKPETIAPALFEWLEERTPPGCRWEFTDMGCGHPGTTPTDSPSLRAAVAAMREASGVEAKLIKSGGSIPIAGLLKDRLGLDTIFMGFGLEDDRIHSPNEKFELDCFRLGAKSHALLIEKLWTISY
ncbi:MAG: M20/M25/M40 family metallo-hydrolase [Leptolyngbya sp. SIO3F4]|nr:M20/M25/M40 family metallo-hydrolase [Leptolyngbya sp. SIO3F4]